jgi:xanthine dehydrogenase YagR molybdenum-binding subunit
MTRHRIRLGALSDDTLSALIHHAQFSTSRFDDFAMEGTDVAASLYGIASVQMSESIVRIDSNTPGQMRAPPEVPCPFALESAIDEPAATLALDPVEVRSANDTAVDRVTDKRFVPRMLMPCFDAGAAAFGWSRRTAAPRSLREGDWLIGLGCASAVRPAKLGPATVRVLADARRRLSHQTARVHGRAIDRRREFALPRSE